MRVMTIVGRLVRQIVGDRRTLAMIVVVPLFLFTMIYFLLGDSGYQPSVDAAGIAPQLTRAISGQGAFVQEVTEEQGRADVKGRRADALLYADGTNMVVLLETNDAVKSGVVLRKVQDAARSLSGVGTVRTEFLYGKSDGSLFDSLGYVMLGIVAFFIVFILAGVSFVRERTAGTMERMMMTPVRRWQVVLGYTLAFGLFAALQSILMLAFVKWVLRMPFAGSAVLAGLIMLLLALSAVSIGAFFSIFSGNEFQIVQFIPVVVIPQIFFSGLISLDTLPFHLGLLSRIMPVFYACDALKSVTIRGEGLTAVWPDLTALLLFAALFSGLNIRVLKRYRQM